jgi:putative sterol carrier protein
MTRLDEFTRRLKDAAGADSGLGKTLKFDFMDEGFIHIDGGSVTNDDKPADLTLTVSMDDMEVISQGKLAPTTALMTGRLFVSDVGVATDLQEKIQALLSRMP